MSCQKWVSCECYFAVLQLMHQAFSSSTTPVGYTVTLHAASQTLTMQCLWLAMALTPLQE